MQLAVDARARELASDRQAMVYDVILVVQDYLEVINKQTSKYHRMQSQVIESEQPRLIS